MSFNGRKGGFDPPNARSSRAARTKFEENMKEFRLFVSPSMVDPGEEVYAVIFVDGKQVAVIERDSTIAKFFDSIAAANTAAI